MEKIKIVITRRMMLWISNMILCFIFVINFLNNNFLLRFTEYGEYQCGNIITRVLNISVEEQIKLGILDEAVTKSDSGIIDFNTDIFNSLLCNVINRSQKILALLEKGYIEDDIINKLGLQDFNAQYLNDHLVYSIPVSMVFDNFLIGNLGWQIPVRYKLISSINGQVVSEIEEYGINNALLKIGLEISANTEVLVPMLTKENLVSVRIPLIFKVIQGEIPDYYLGTNVIGGVK